MTPETRQKEKLVGAEMAGQFSVIFNATTSFRTSKFGQFRWWDVKERFFRLKLPFV